MNPDSKTHASLRSYLCACAVVLLFSFAPSAFAADWSGTGTVTDPTGGSASGLWSGVTSIYAFIFALIWLGAAVLLAMGWFNFKKGDVSAGLFSLFGGAGLGVTPALVQWFRSF